MHYPNLLQLIPPKKWIYSSWLEEALHYSCWCCFLTTPSFIFLSYSLFPMKKCWRLLSHLSFLFLFPLLGQKVAPGVNMRWSLRNWAWIQSRSSLPKLKLQEMPDCILKSIKITQHYWLNSYSKLCYTVMLANQIYL